LNVEDSVPKKNGTVRKLCSYRYSERREGKMPRVVDFTWVNGGKATNLSK